MLVPVNSASRPLWVQQTTQTDSDEAHLSWSIQCQRDTVTSHHHIM